MSETIIEKIGENEVSKMSANKGIANESQIPYYQTYEKRMSDYMQSVPHIPPTLFELRLRHNDIKTDVIKQFKNNNSNKNNMKQLVSKLDNQLEKIYGVLAKKNVKEYKTCQAGFIIGWKCNVNKPHPKVESTDDRF